MQYSNKKKIRNDDIHIFSDKSTIDKFAMCIYHFHNKSRATPDYEEKFRRLELYSLLEKGPKNLSLSVGVTCKYNAFCFIYMIDKG